MSRPGTATDGTPMPPVAVQRAADPVVRAQSLRSVAPANPGSGRSGR